MIFVLYICSLLFFFSYHFLLLMRYDITMTSLWHHSAPCSSSCSCFVLGALSAFPLLTWIISLWSCCRTLSLYFDLHLSLFQVMNKFCSPVFASQSLIALDVSRGSLSVQFNNSENKQRDAALRWEIHNLLKESYMLQDFIFKKHLFLPC